ncbi:hypothetical protein PCANC_18640 [Puccinia coronata f. sp. avenae]|uniref:Uncharacterized protein n=1 Tax=Puccinia coronata f. sp. avenae TaxID=200324 RepID=A0A2N5U438_9BASI|nr:hypothetical protein PCANC_18640 [Puccinia coronata f. sp. avenae]
MNCHHAIQSNQMNIRNPSGNSASPRLDGRLVSIGAPFLPPNAADGHAALPLPQLDLHQRDQATGIPPPHLGNNPSNGQLSLSGPLFSSGASFPAPNTGVTQLAPQFNFNQASSTRPPHPGHNHQPQHVLYPATTHDYIGHHPHNTAYGLDDRIHIVQIPSLDNSHQTPSAPILANLQHPLIDASLVLATTDNRLPSTGTSSIQSILNENPPNSSVGPATPATLATSSNLEKSNNTHSISYILPEHIIQKYEGKSLRELREMTAHIKLNRLNEAIKLEAQDLYLNYQRNQLLLSLKHQRSFKALTTYLGQRRSRVKKSKWHRFMGDDPANAYSNVGKSIGQRNKDASKAYKNANNHQPSNIASCDHPPTTTGPQSQPLTNSMDADAEERSVFKKKTKPIKKLHAEVVSWASDIQKKLRELSDAIGIEGFLVLAGQDRRKPFFFQGGSIYSEQFLRGLVKEDDPIGDYACWISGSRIRKRTLNQLSEATTEAADKPSKKTKKDEANAYKDVCQGNPAKNRKYISEALGKMYVEINKGTDTHGWPGTNTQKKLAKYRHKLVVEENNDGLKLEHLDNVPIKSIQRNEAWLILRGLKNNWIKLVPNSDPSHSNANASNPILVETSRTNANISIQTSETTRTNANISNQTSVETIRNNANISNQTSVETTTADANIDKECNKNNHNKADESSESSDDSESLNEEDSDSESLNEEDSDSESLTEEESD